MESPADSTPLATPTKVSSSSSGPNATTFYAIALPHEYLHDEQSSVPSADDRVFTELKEASKLLRQYKGSRMKSFATHELAQQFVEDSQLDDVTLNESMMNLSIGSDSNSGSPQSKAQQQPEQQQQSQSPHQRQKLTPRPQSPVQKEQKSDNGADNSTTPTTPKTPTKQTISEASKRLLDPSKRGSQWDPSMLSPSITQEREFPTARNEDLSRLRRAIERNDEPIVREMIEENPRLLISVCDTPVILMAGPRYNACHVAARANRAPILNLILDTIGDIDYVARLYPADPIQRALDCQQFVLDLYLNTPDKVLGNTPLHFACKLGHHEVIRALLAHKSCDVDKIDRQGKTARQCIGERVSNDANKAKLCQQLDSLFQTRQLLRRERCHQRERAASASPQRDSLNHSRISARDSLDRLSLSWSFDRLNLSANE